MIKSLFGPLAPMLRIIITEHTFSTGTKTAGSLVRRTIGGPLTTLLWPHTSHLPHAPKLRGLAAAYANISTSENVEIDNSKLKHCLEITSVKD